MERLLERLKNVLELIVISKNESSIKTTIHFGESLIEFETGKAKIRDFIYNSTQNISREITGNIGSKGESYITTYKKEYFKMLRTALGGGFLVAFACF
nr:hypothetical protein [Saprospiraceae bacterium]